MTYNKNIISDYITLTVRDSTADVSAGVRSWAIPDNWYSNQRSKVCTVTLVFGNAVMAAADTEFGEEDRGINLCYLNGAQNSMTIDGCNSMLANGYSYSGDNRYKLESCGSLLVTARPCQIRMKYSDYDGDGETPLFSEITLRYDYYDSTEISQGFHEEFTNVL